jgi:hypothetical protein
MTTSETTGMPGAAAPAGTRPLTTGLMTTSPLTTSPAYRIGDHRYVRHDPAFEEALALAYAHRLRPCCLCRPEGVEMYVCRLAEHYVLKRMPMTADRHAEYCLARHGVVTIQASLDFRDPAVQTERDGSTTVSIDVPLHPRCGDSPIASPVASKVTNGSSGPPTWRRHRFNLAELLDYLWKAAELDWWHPRFEGRRTWAVVRALLRRAMHDKFIGGHPMAAHVFVPEAFRLEDQFAIAARRQRQWFGQADSTCASSVDTKCRGRQRLGRRQIVIAEVKCIGALRRDGCRDVTLRHLPDVAFAIRERQWQFVSRAHEVPLQLWAQGEVPHLLCAAVFDPQKQDLHEALIEPRPHRAGGVNLHHTTDRSNLLRSLTLLPATDQWQLVTGRLDVDRLRRLVHVGKPFSAERPVAAASGLRDRHGVDAHAPAAPRQPASANPPRWP